MTERYAIPTVAVVHPEGEAHGFVVLNESDFDAARHTLWTADAAPDAAKPPKRGAKP